jgi:hypothetical protein
MKCPGRKVNEMKNRLMGNAIMYASALMCLSIPTLSLSDNLSSWNSQRLFSPSPALLTAEGKGRITIYDGLDHTVVEQAMDQQFDRIENMMFIRTKYVLPSGEVYQDDDC